MKAVEEKNRGEMNVFSQGRGEDYGELLESVSYGRGAGQIISDCTETELHIYTTSHRFYFLSRVEKQALHKTGAK